MPNVSLQHSQEPTTSSYPEPDESGSICSTENDQVRGHV